MKIPVFSFLLSLILSVLAAISPLEAQENLVPNGDFEEYTLCPKSIIGGLNLVPGWYNANDGTSDYFNSCTGVNDIFFVPENSAGFQNAKSGTGYVGFLPVAVPFETSKRNSYYYEYLTLKLKSELVKNNLYCFEMNISRADSTYFVVNKLNIICSSDSIFNNGTDEYFIEKNNATKYSIDISETECTSWLNVQIDILAQGGEKFLSIGLFDTNYVYSQVNYCGPKEPKEGGIPYYYVDDVALYTNFESCNLSTPKNIPNFFSPNQDGINDFFLVDGDNRLMVQNRWGQILFIGESSKGWDGKWNGKEMATGVYFYILTDENDNTKTGYFHLWR